MLTAKAAFSGISTNDLQKTKQFYTEVLGLTLTSEKMGLEFQLPNNSGQLFIYEKPDHAPASFTVLNFVVEDIKQAVDSLTSQGVVFEHYDFGGGAKTDENGIMYGLPTNDGPNIAWFKDPSGNVLAVLQNE